MRQAVVSVDNELLAEQGLRFDVFQDAGVLDTAILSCEGSRGVVRIQVEEQLESQQLDEMDAIQWWEQASNGGSEYVYLVEVGATDVEETGDAGDERYPRCERITVTDNGVTLTYTGSQDQLGDELTALSAAGNDVTLRKLRSYRIQETPLDTLTDRQQEVIELAFERGYYDIPRETSVQDIAAELELDDSTVAEHLQRAERNLLETILDRSS